MSVTEPIFTTRLAHELPLVTEALEAKGVPYVVHALGTQARRWPSWPPTQNPPYPTLWSVEVPPSAVRVARATVYSLPVSRSLGAIPAIGTRDIRRGTLVLAILAILVVAYTLAVTLFGFTPSRLIYPR
jgi:hypothetical protein